MRSWWLLTAAVMACAVSCAPTPVADRARTERSEEQRPASGSESKTSSGSANERPVDRGPGTESTTGSHQGDSNRPNSPAAPR
jgi:hypothetical protein